MALSLSNDLFLRACRLQPVERTPVWIMRQAGRYLPQYQKIREKYDFSTLYKTPKLAAEVTIQPIDILGVDAAIIFSDILVVPEALGMNLAFIEGEGPVFEHPIADAGDIERLKYDDSIQRLSFVFDAISLTKRELNNRIPLIGFSGSPWTLLVYMIEGGVSHTFSKIKRFIYTEPARAHIILGKLARIIGQYLSAQIAAGADAVQIFDTWGGILAPLQYREFSLNYTAQVIAECKRKNEPIIIFSKGTVNQYDATINAGADVLSMDWNVDIGEVRRNIQGKAALQGNLDPHVLCAPPEVIKQEVWHILESYGSGSGHIFNLGHGILPDTPPENAQALVQFVKELSPQYHKYKKS